MDNRFVVEEDDLSVLLHMLDQLFEIGVAQLVCPPDVTKHVFECYKRVQNVMADAEEVWSAGETPTIIIHQEAEREATIPIGSKASAS